MNFPGVVVRAGANSVKQTIDKIEAFLREHGVTIYARIDQQAELNNNGLNIDPLEYLLFGNPKAGGPIMQHEPIAALDLPLKMIAWEDEAGKIWIAYNDPNYVKDRFFLSGGLVSPLNLGPVIEKALTA